MLHKVIKKKLLYIYLNAMNYKNAYETKIYNNISRDLFLFNIIYAINNLYKYN